MEVKTWKFSGKAPPPDCGGNDPNAFDNLAVYAIMHGVGCVT